MPATKQLFILRHAKSSWEDPSIEDHERPLAPRGRRAVEVLAAHMRARGIQPAQVLCSSSRRTRETLDGLGLGGEKLIEDELYSASAREVVGRLRRVPAEVPSVMVIGHNPTSQMLVLQLAARGSSDADNRTRAAIERKFPTGALATLTFELTWAELAPGSALLIEFVRPKELGKSMV